LPFFEFLKLEQNAALVLTDSGTVQEECSILRVPAITIRETTERPETIECGSNIVATTDPHRILSAAKYLKASGAPASWDPPVEYLRTNVSDVVTRILLAGEPHRTPPSARRA
jgi:UDP-N-acetylglucosamine 2-epimerase (non-hydrolysing)